MTGGAKSKSPVSKKTPTSIAPTLKKGKSDLEELPKKQYFFLIFFLSSLKNLAIFAN